MSTAPPCPAGRFAVEATPIGDQSLVPGVAPIVLADRLRWRAEAALAPRKPQRACDHGLFDLAARDQLDLFALLRAADAAPASPSRIHQLPPPGWAAADAGGRSPPSPAAPPTLTDRRTGAHQGADR